MRATAFKNRFCQTYQLACILLFSVTGVLSPLSGQHSINPDSIKQQLHLSEGAEKIELLRALSNFYIADYQIDSENYSDKDFVKYATQLYGLDTEASLKEKMSLLYDINYSQLILEDYTGILQTRDKLHQLLEEVPEFDDYWRLFSFEIHAAHAYTALDSFSQYYTSLQKSMVYAEKSGDLGHLAMINNLLGELYTDVLQDYESGLSAYQKELEATTTIYESNKEDVQERNFLSIALLNVGISHMHLNRLDSAEYYLNRAYEVIEQDNLPESKAYKVVALSKLSEKKGMHERAFQLGVQALELAKQGDGKQILIESLINLASIELKSGDFERANAYLDQATTYITTYDHKKLSNEKLELYELYYQLYREQDTDKALAYHEQFVALEDSLQDRQNMATILKSDIKFEARQEQLLYELKQNKKLAQQRLIMSLLAILLLSATIIGSIAYRNSRREKKNASLMQELNTALSTKQDKLETLNHKLNRFAHSISHDVRSRLNKIESYGEVLKDGSIHLDQQEKKYFVVKIMKATSSLKEYCDDLLQWSRQEEVADEKIDLNSLVNKVVEGYSNTVEQHRFTVKIDQLPNVLMAEGALLQIFQNLIDNAIKFSKNEAKPFIHIYANEQEDFWEVGVRDNGIGLDETSKQLVANPTYKNANKGLFIIKDILQDYDEHLYCESSDEGTCFWFTSKKVEVELSALTALG
ncbi:MAG: ATP-binding protein [Bacteroidota bacterium]